MLRKCILSSVVLFVVLCCNAQLKYPSSVKEVLKMLDEAIEQKDTYVGERFRVIDSLKMQLQKSKNAVTVFAEIADEFRGLDIDSAVIYYSKAITSARSYGDTVKCQQLELLRASIMPVSGVIRESVAVFDSIGNCVYDENRALFYESGNKLFYYVLSFYPYEELKDGYFKRCISYTDSLLSVLPEDAIKYKLYNAQALLMKGDKIMAMALLEDVIRETSMNENVFARATAMYASIMKEMGDDESYTYYLALSATSDVVTGTREGTSLQRLGEALYRNGDVERAYTVLTASLNNAVNSGARIRAWETSQALPIISRTFREQDQMKWTWLWALILCLSIAIIVIACVIVYLHKEKRKLEILKMRLTKSNYVKEMYISQFLGLCSLYIEKLEEFNKLAGRKITAGQVEELYDMIKSGKMLDEQHDLFYEMFDNAFIHIYPTFVDEINRLLEADKPIVLSDGAKLNMELRIVAFMRLGIDDSSQIARFLGLSLNTIYTYRNKMRSRAINRETFERDLMKIGALY